jgi:hypothetical protein
MNHIALIGAGQLGSRHLQALALLNIPAYLYVVDPNPDSLKTARERFLQIPHNNKTINVAFYSQISQLPSVVELAIVATNADIRLNVLKSLFQYCQPKFLVLEKVLFQAVKDYESARALFKQFNSKAWVNCPKRMYAGYRKIEQYLNPDAIFNCKVFGNQWGLACNSIHFIDLLAMYTKDSSYVLDLETVDSEIRKSVRNSFFELTGTITGKFSKGSVFSLTSNKTGDISLNIEISQENLLISVNEMKGEISIQKSEDGLPVKIPLERTFQSELTNKVVEDILDTQTCLLTPYQESMELHIPFISALSQIFCVFHESGIEYCPIT